MKSMSMALLCLFGMAALTTAALVQDHRVARLAAAPAASDAPAPAKEAEKKDAEKKDKPAVLETLHIKFEIENFNYYDLTKETCPKTIAKKHHHQKKHKKVANDDKVDKVDKVDKPDKKEQPAAAPPMPVPKAPATQSESDKLPWMKKDAQDKPPPPPAPKAAAPKADAKPAIDALHDTDKQITTAVKEGLDGFGPTPEEGKPPWSKDNAASFLQVSQQVSACVARQDLGETKSTECTTIMDVLRDTIKETVGGIISCLYMQSIEPLSLLGAPGPSPSASPSASPGPAVAFLVKSTQNGPAPAPAPGPAPAPSGPPPMPDVQIFVTFSPGKKVGNGRATVVEISFLDTSGNGVDDVLAAKPFILESINNSLFNNQLEDALDEVTNIVPELKDVEMKTEKIEQWNIKKCEKHLRSIVDEFTHHYTRRQVPMALYNECTNFMTRMSFSHDYVLDPMDTVRCRRATKKFATHWNFGKKAEEKDFEQMCLNACEAKYGRNAPKCNVAHGQGLLNKPL